MSTSLLNGGVCPFCGMRSMIVKFTRKGLPSAYCRSCFMRLFLSDTRQLASLAFIAQTYEDQGIAGKYGFVDKAFSGWREQFDATVREMQEARFVEDKTPVSKEG